MLDECITKLHELDRHIRKVNEMTPDMHEKYEKALIELLQLSVIENQKAAATIRKLQNELKMTRSGLQALISGLHN